MTAELFFLLTVHDTVSEKLPPVIKKEVLSLD